MNLEEFIEHHGVKGMKWGTRTARGARTKVSTANKKRIAKKKTARTKYSKSPKRLTEQELLDRIKRMETEKQYNKLNRRDVSVGEKLATEMMTNIGRTTIQTIAVGTALYGTKKLIEKKNPDLAKSIGRKK